MAPPAATGERDPLLLPSALLRSCSPTTTAWRQLDSRCLSEEEEEEDSLLLLLLL